GRSRRRRHQLRRRRRRRAGRARNSRRRHAYRQGNGRHTVDLQAGETRGDPDEPADLGASVAAPATVVFSALCNRSRAHGLSVGRGVQARRARFEGSWSLVVKAISEDPFRMLVESIVDYAIYMLDPGGCVTSWNAGAERIKGFQAEEIVGKHFSQLCTEEDTAAGLPETVLELARRGGKFG